jgi:hypothetical protein
LQSLYFFFLPEFTTMRLLNVRTLQLKSFFGEPEPYAILSHRWGEEEVLFSNLADLENARKYKGFSKLEKACEQAIKDGLNYIWIDTCCIDKSSSAELSEAINSMFTWYKDSDTCYAYLDDVKSDGSNLVASRWFTRSWTLQELMAPRSHQCEDSPGVVFFSCDWEIVGNKASLSDSLASITGIEKEYLQGKCLNKASISMRMSWAANREATRAEDVAYSLLGIFDVNMPLLYGEGKVKAFRRLQEEIMKISEDETLFAWDRTESTATGVLASEPKEFSGARYLIPWLSDDPVIPHTMTHRGLRIWLQYFRMEELSELRSKAGRSLLTALAPQSGSMSDSTRMQTVWAVLRCHIVHDFTQAVLLPLQHVVADIYLRAPDAHIALLSTIACKALEKRPPREIYVRNIPTPNSTPRRYGILIRTLPEDVSITEVMPAECWNPEDMILQRNINGIGDWLSASLRLSGSFVTPACEDYVFLKLGYTNYKMWCHLDNKVWRQTRGNLKEFHGSRVAGRARKQVSKFYDEAGEPHVFQLRVELAFEKVFGQPMWVLDVQHLSIVQPVKRAQTLA